MRDVLTFAIVFLIFIGIAVLITMESKRFRRLKGLPPASGFGGWLIVLAIHEAMQLINPTREIIMAMGLLPAYVARIELALLVPYLLIILFTNVAMYRRRRYFRYAYLAQAAYAVFINGLNALGTSWQEGDRLAYIHGQIFGGIAAAIVWTVYVFTSERVKNTFVRPEALSPKVAEVF